VEGKIHIAHARAVCRLVRNGETIESKLHWLT
jgi:hypothetical protein